jgi:hypothetical protein
VGDERAWQADLERLRAAHRRFEERLRSTTEEALSATIEPYQGRPGYPAAIRYARTATHDTYHLGQIRYLRALQGR